MGRKLAWLFLATLFCGTAQAQQKTLKVACIGNSITYGANIENRERDSYPAVLGRMLGPGYEVRNFGLNGRTLLNKAETPYMKEAAFREAQRYAPDIVVVKLGTNDSKPWNWKYGSDFEKDLETMVATLGRLPSKPRIYLCHPAKAYKVQYGINDSVIVHGIIPVIDRVAARRNLQVIDLHGATDGMPECFPDAIHPDPKGAFVMAGAVYKTLTGRNPLPASQFVPGTTGKTVRVACIGASVTYGHGIPNRERDSYPAVLGQMLGDGYEVCNFGVSGTTLLSKGDNPYIKTEAYRDALAYNPDIVVVDLGGNDTKPQNWKYAGELGQDTEAMVNAFASLPARPRVYLCRPTTVYKDQWGINDSISVNGVTPVIGSIAAKTASGVIDLRSATAGMPAHFPDGVHPDAQGAFAMAGAVYESLAGQKSDFTGQAFPGRKSTWSGHDRYDFKFLDRDVIVVAPAKAAEGKPWIWRPAFFDAFPSVDKALLEEGFHVAYYDLTHLYGSPRACELGKRFYEYMTGLYGLSRKVTLEGFSRGGLFALNWAARNPEKVACIYIDAPVCDIFFWPGRKNKKLWNDLLKEWNMTDEQIEGFNGNPVDNLEPIARAGIPIFSVCGDSDRVVPYVHNMDVVRSRYLALGGPVEVILKPGVDHHPHSLENPAPVVDFILRNQPEYEKYQHYTPRGSLRNSLVKFEKERKGRVAFLGGSITEMNGWRTMIQQQLRQRFPFTEFEFVDAGISSTGTTPGAFRLQNDILSKGKIDLLFVEAAVNDDTNHFTPEEQVRGMEGEVRHALQSNPDMDIVMLHFIYDPFIPTIAGGRTPDVILNHERVANHYLIPSVNLAQEIAERMRDGQFDWDRFGGTHPKPFGHKFYAAAINRLFDKMWSEGLTPDAKIVPHEIPAEPLDKYSYFNGRFTDIGEASLKGWKYVESWRPEGKAGTRKGFVDVPMIEATRPGDKLSLPFKGKAVGIFCVSGPSAGILEYSVDGAPFKKLDTYTEWSGGLYIPWVYMLETELEPGEHNLVLRISKDRNPDSKGTECQIRNFVVNE